MNKSMLPGLEWHRLNLRPIPRRLTQERLGLSQLDAEFIVVRASRDGLDLEDSPSGVILRLNPDHIREYISNREYGGLKYGFLKLKVQVYLEDRRAWVEPL